jgi:hypothetical protein
VAIEALAQPRLVPGVQVTILDLTGVPLGGGPLRVERIEFNGSNEGESVMSGIARRVALL